MRAWWVVPVVWKLPPVNDLPSLTLVVSWRASYGKQMSCVFSTHVGAPYLTVGQHKWVCMRSPACLPWGVAESVANRIRSSV